MHNSSEEKKHIAMYIGSLQKGGAERVMVNLAEYFWSVGYRVTLVTTYIAPVEYEIEHVSWKVVKTEDGTQQSNIVEFEDGTQQSNIVGFEDGIQQGDIAACGESTITASASDYVQALITDSTDKFVTIDLKGGLEGGIDRIFSSPDTRGMSRIAAFAARYKTLRVIWKKLNPDLILSFIGKNNIMAIQTARGLGIPVVVSVRAKLEMEYPSKAMMAAMKFTFPKAAAVVMQSNGAMKELPAKVRAKAVMLPNSIKPDFIRKPFDGEREKTIVSVGRIDDNKNQELLIRAFSKLAPKYPDYRLIIYGDGPCRHKLEELIVELNLKDKVLLPGSRSDIADQIYKAGIYVLSSDMEGMPNSLIEAMSLGLPCIMTDCMYDSTELIQDGQNGLLTPVGDVDKMSEAIRRIIDNPSLAADLGRNAAHVQETYSPDVVNRKWEDCLTSVMTQKVVQ